MRYGKSRRALAAILAASVATSFGGGPAWALSVDDVPDVGTVTVPDLPVPDPPPLPKPPSTPKLPPAPDPVPAPKLPPAPAPPPAPKPPVIKLPPPVPDPPSAPKPPKLPKPPNPVSSSPTLSDATDVPTPAATTGAGVGGSGVAGTPAGTVAPAASAPGTSVASGLPSTAPAAGTRGPTTHSPLAAAPGRRGARGVERPLTRRAAARQRLRRSVAQFEGCLSDLAPRERRVLVLRAGLGPRPALSRLQVAHRLALGRAQVAQIERRGLHRLDALARSTTCAGSAASPLAVLAGAGSPLAAALQSSAGALGGADGASAAESAPARSQVKGISDRSPDAGGAPPTPLPQNQGVIALLVLVIGGLLLGLRMRHELRH